MGARASHASVVVNESSIWVIGGAHFSGSNFSLVTVYDIPTAKWRTVETLNPPESRYDHSVVRYKVSDEVVIERIIAVLLYLLIYILD